MVKRLPVVDFVEVVFNLEIVPQTDVIRHLLDRTWVKRFHFFGFFFEWDLAFDIIEDGLNISNRFLRVFGLQSKA